MTLYEIAERIYALEKQGKRVINLNIGATNLPVPECAKEAAIKCIREKRSGYGPSAGIPELREKIAEREGCEASEVFVGPGSKQVIYGMLNALRGKGKAVFPQPHWPAYPLICANLGIESVRVPSTLEGNWEFGSLPLSDAGVVIICNPLNPTSTAYPQRLVQGAIDDAAEKGVPVILDEAYRALSYVEIPNYEGMHVRSFSKEFNFEGWRLGYAVAPKDLVKKLSEFSQMTCTCVPEFVQRGGIACLDNEKEIISANKAVWKSRIAVASKGLKSLGFRFSEPDSGIYLFPTHPQMEDSEKFALSLLEHGVAIVPGTEFGDYRRFFRICLNQHENVLEEAIGLMGKALGKK
jgi:aspartate aminotransferase